MIKKIYWHYPHLRFWMGGSRFLYEVTSRINKKYKNLNVTIITNQINKKFLDKFKKDNVNVLLINKLACTNDFYYWLFFPIFFIYELIITFLKTKSADILIATLFPSNLITAIISKIQKKPYYFYCYEPFPFFHNKKLINEYPEPRRTVVKILAFLYGWLDIWASRQANLIITLDKFKGNLIKKIYKKNYIIIPVGVDVDHFKKKIDKKLFEKYKKDIIIFHCTDYHELKNTDLVIKALSIVVKKIPNVKLLISSTQPNSQNRFKYFNLVKKLKLTNYVWFLGLIPFEQLPLYYSLAKVYISGGNSLETAGDWPVKEALACETPAIRSSIGTSDVIDDMTGYIVNPKNTDLFAKKIIQAIIRNDKFDRKKGRIFIIENYSWDYVIKKLNNILKNK